MKRILTACLVAACLVAGVFAGLEGASGGPQTGLPEAFFTEGLAYEASSPTDRLEAPWQRKAPRELQASSPQIAILDHLTFPVEQPQGVYYCTLVSQGDAARLYDELGVPNIGYRHRSGRAPPG